MSSVARIKSEILSLKGALDQDSLYIMTMLRYYQDAIQLMVARYAEIACDDTAERIQVLVDLRKIRQFIISTISKAGDTDANSIDRKVNRMLLRGVGVMIMFTNMTLVLNYPCEDIQFQLLQVLQYLNAIKALASEPMKQCMQFPVYVQQIVAYFTNELDQQSGSSENINTVNRPRSPRVFS